MRTDLPDLGAAVTASREARAVTVEDLGRATKIRAETLRRVERGEVGALGAPVYVRGHLRSVASALGVDAAPWLEQYEAAGDAGPSGVTVSPDPVAVRSDAIGLPPWLRVGAAAVALLVVLGGIGLLASGGEGVGDADLALPGEEQPAEPPAPPPVAGPQDAPAPDAVASAPAQASLEVAAATGRSWVRVSDPAGAVLFEGILETGSSRTFTHPEELRVVVGAAPAVTLAVNGQSPVVAGPEGPVARLTVTPQGLGPSAP